MLESREGGKWVYRGVLARERVKRRPTGMRCSSVGQNQDPVVERVEGKVIFLCFLDSLVPCRPMVGVFGKV